LPQICTKVGWGFAPDPTWGTYSAPPDPLAVFRWPLLRREEEGRDRAEDGMGGRGRRAERGGPEREGERSGTKGPHDPLAWGPPMS